jgi:hypothetical protein
VSLPRFQVSKFQTAAKLEAEVAVLMEGDKNYGEACKRWRRACNFLKADGVHDDKAGLCLLRAADHAATMGNYEEASALYEEIGHSLLQSSLLKFSASRIFLRSLLCYLAMVCRSVVGSLWHGLTGCLPTGQREQNKVQIEKNVPEP